MIVEDMKMKQLTCEMCGSTDLTKQDGVFVCQSCGTKYSVEEAKKMMIEGTVEVAGTIKVDDTAKIANYYTMAESAYDVGNQKEAESYCNRIIEIDPNNYKAWLLKGRAAGWQSTLANIRVEESVNCFNKAIDNAPEDKVEEVKKAASDEISQLSLALITLCCDNYSKHGSINNADIIKKNVIAIKHYSLLLLAKCGVKATDINASIALKINSAVVAAYENDIEKDYWGSTGHPSRVAWDRYKEQCCAAIELVDFAIKLSDDDDVEDKTRYENKIFLLKKLESSGSYHYSNGTWSKEYALSGEAKQKIIDMIMECHNKIKEIDPSYTIPERPQQTNDNGCYIATAVYGSYDCPQVWTLRRFRDYTLAKTWYGRAFICTYYAISPTFVKWFGKTEWFKKIWKGQLDRMVEKLQSEGIESTPYEDQEW
jgi:cold-shock DNA-binding domain protein